MMRESYTTFSLSQSGQESELSLSQGQERPHRIQGALQKKNFFIGWEKVPDHMQVISNIELLPTELRIDYCTGVLY